ncbi:MAG: hypothetical protein R3B81_06785 [bacterium]
MSTVLQESVEESVRPAEAPAAAAPGDSKPETTAPAADDKKRAEPGFVPRAVLGGVGPLVVLAAAGSSYYSMDLAERLRSPLHDWLRPTGLVGQSLGFLAFALFLFLWLYPVRKRVAALSFLGPVPKWLDAHIVAGVVMPLAGAIHAGFRFSGLIGVGYFSMLVVAISGVVGRYLYLRIPRGRSGLEMTREQVSADRRQLVGALAETTGFDPQVLLTLLKPVQTTTRGIIPTLWRLVQDDFDRRRAIRRLLREWNDKSAQRPDAAALKNVARLARREMALAQQIRVLDATGRVFRLWHAFHLPFAITAFLAVTVHVTLAIAFGVTWIR